MSQRNEIRQVFHRTTRRSSPQIMSFVSDVRFGIAAMVLSPASRTALALTAVALGAAAGDRAAPLDAYGGWTDIKGRATGWFHLEAINGRTLLVTPDGHGFVALGINHFNTLKGQGDGEANLFRDRYGSDWEKFAAEVGRQYEAWGLNTVDHGVEPLRRARPYFAARDLVRTSKYFARPGEPNAWEFPDVFDPVVVARLEREVEAFCREHRDSKYLIAYHWTDTPTWDLHKTRRFRQTDWVSEIRRLPGTTAGRQAYAGFLREQYDDDIARFNRAYDLAVGSFAGLATADLRAVAVNRYEVERDDQAFLGRIAQQYYRVVGTAMRRHDPHHMVFGEKYLLGDNPPQVVAAAAPYIDALALQPGDGYIPDYTPGDVYPAREIAGLHEVSGRPVFICDHQISFATPRYPVAIWPYHQRRDETDAAEATGRFMRAAFAHPYVIGYMRCQYIDRFSPRRGAIKLGLLRDDGTPYLELVDATVRASADVQEMVRRAAGRPGSGTPSVRPAPGR